MRALVKSAAILYVCLAAAPARAAERRYESSVSVMLGLSQWLLWEGGNVAAQVKRGRWVFEYSHGQGLNLSRVEALGLSGAERDAGVRLELPFTTGGGVGYRILPNLHLLLEVKAHRYVVRGFDRNEELDYWTFTVGPGLFYELHLWKGLFLQPSIRWWPTVASTLDEDEARLATASGESYEHEAHVLPPFVNVNLGWQF